MFVWLNYIVSFITDKLLLYMHIMLYSYAVANVVVIGNDYHPSCIEMLLDKPRK